MSNFHQIYTDKLVLNEDGTQKDLSIYLPYSVMFSVPDFSNGELSQDITVNIKNMGDIDYSIFPYNQYPGSYSTPVYLTCQVRSRDQSSVSLRFYNEQRRTSIASTNWAILVVPLI